MDFLINFFLKPDKRDVDRQEYGNFATIVGLVINILLFIIKFIAGIITKSISIKGDAINNLSDSFSSILSLISFKISSKPADKEHPFGHARTEYIFSSFMSMIIILISYKLVRESIEKILEPQKIVFSYITIIILLISIFAKYYQGIFYKKIGEKIDSNLLIANSVDSKSDVISTTSILIATVFSKFISFPVDGIMGIVVSIIIFKSGLEILIDTVNRIVGEAPTVQEEEKIIEFVESYDGILGTHDLIVHDYGSNHVFASIHAEVNAKKDVILSHEIIDKIENDAITKLGIQLIIHMDPLIVDDVRINKFNKYAEDCLREIDSSLSLHDFRIVDSGEIINLIFDVDVPAETEISDDTLKLKMVKKLRVINPKFHPVITVDRNYLKSHRSEKIF